MALIARRARIWRPSSPAPAPVDRHVVIRIIAGHGRILRLDIDNPPHSSRTNRPVLAAELRRIANVLDPQEAQQ